MLETNNLSSIELILEKQELEYGSAGLPVSNESYTKLLAAYLANNDLNHAKYLWKRIPQSLKENQSELTKVWTVGQKMWQRDFPSIYISLQQTWSTEIAPIMSILGDRVRERALNLVATAYSSISITDLCQFTGMSLEETSNLATARGWIIEEGSIVWVLPKKPEALPRQHVSCEEQLIKLTDVVSFLEN